LSTKLKTTAAAKSEVSSRESMGQECRAATMAAL
jgi:hypothetical protein